MSRRFYEGDSEFSPCDYGNVFCELTGGGAQDGLVLRMARRFAFISNVADVSVYDGDPLVLRWCVFEGTYEYQGSYRLCSSAGRIYQYKYTGVEGYEKSDFEQRIEDASREAGCSLSLAEFYGTHGWDECQGEY
ncbi:MAG: hypothetical protein ACK42H_07305 [Planctomycetota bacterium]|jgi:hypothetical protein